MSTRVTRVAEEVFLEVADLPAGERTAALDRLCGSDAELRRVVESLLGFHAGAEDFLERPEFLTQVQARPRRDDGEDTDSLIPGTRVGEYTIRGLLGTGGMGSVYIAEQERPRRTVALKVIRRGYATPSLQRRFEHEAEVLGKLQHPGIAQIYEAGAAEVEPGEDPQPFIAMELVRGPTLNAFAEQNALTLPAKLELIARVCDAVHHAHQRGVIHRDLKPQNILVDEQGQPKILDFGVARAADADLRVTTLQTSVGQLIGTLPYMSPEQVLADPGEVDTRSDVYALGVIMYQVLTGRLPLDVSSRSIPEAARVIRDQAPARLSSVSKIYRGDIETIVSKALDKDKTRRYQSAADVASDIRRYLNGDPIAAKVDSSLYVLKKQLKRYQGVVIAAGVFGLAVAGFAVHATLQWRTNVGLVRTGEAQAERLRRNLYLSNIGYTQAALAVNDVERMRRILDSCPEDLRGWEWSYLDRASDDTAICLPITRETSLPLAVSGDCRFAIVCTADGVVRVVDAVSGEERCSFTHPINGKSAAADTVFSRDGATLLIGWSNAITRVDLATGVGETVFSSADTGIVQIRVWAISPDGLKFLALVPGQSNIAVMDTATGAISARLTAPGAVVGCFGSDGRVLLGYRDGMVREFEIGDGSVVREYPGHAGEVRDIKAGPAGKFASAGSDQSVRVWNAADGSSIAVTDFEARVNGLAWSRDGTIIAAGGSDRVLRVIDAATGRVLRRLGGHTGPIRSACFPPDSRFVVSTGYDRTVRWWTNYSSPRELTAVLDHVAVWSGAVSPDGARLILADSKKRVRSFDLETLSQPVMLPEQQEATHTTRFSPDGRLLATGGWDGSLQIRDAHSGAVLVDITEHPRAWASGVNRVIETVFTADSRALLTASSDSTVRLWDVTGGRLLQSFIGSGGPVGAVCASPDGAHFAAAWNRERSVRVFDLSTGEPTHVLEGLAGYAWEIAYSRDGKSLLAAGDDASIYVWDLRTPTAPPRTLKGHRGAVHRLSLSPDGKRLASGGYDGRVRVWDLESGEEVLNLPGFIGAVYFVSFTPDGSRIVAATSDGEIKVWDARPRPAAANPEWPDRESTGTAHR